MLCPHKICGRKEEIIPEKITLPEGLDNIAIYKGYVVKAKKEEKSKISVFVSSQKANQKGLFNTHWFTAWGDKAAKLSKEIEKGTIFEELVLSETPYISKDGKSMVGYTLVDYTIKKEQETVPEMIAEVKPSFLEYASNPFA